MRDTDKNKAVFLFLATFIIGWAFFLLPLSYQGKLTVPFDILVGWLRKHANVGAQYYTFFLALTGGLLTLLARTKAAGVHGFVRAFETSLYMAVFRIAGAVLAFMYLMRWVPGAFEAANIPALIWNVLAVSVALIIPLGAVVVQLFVSYGGMDFLGTLSEPVMRPLFRLPGRAALDALTSWVGSYSVGLYITRTVYLRGLYSKRHVFILATCFSTVSMGFVGVVADTLRLLHLFPLILLVYLAAIVLTAVILVRVPPISRIPNAYVTSVSVPGHNKLPSPEGPIWKRAWQAALAQASASPPLSKALPRAFAEGLLLAASILGTIISIGTLALVLAKFTPVFQILGRPLVPVLEILQIPNAAQVAPAVLIEVTEMYIPALLVMESSEPARFFVATLSISQLIFFSSLGPMIMDMFRDIPIKAGQLLLLFFLRTAILLPLLAVLLALLKKTALF